MEYNMGTIKQEQVGMMVMAFVWNRRLMQAAAGWEWGDGEMVRNIGERPRRGERSTEKKISCDGGGVT